MIVLPFMLLGCLVNNELYEERKEILEIQEAGFGIVLDGKSCMQVKKTITPGEKFTFEAYIHADSFHGQPSSLNTEFPLFVWENVFSIFQDANGYLRVAQEVNTPERGCHQGEICSTVSLLDGNYHHVSVAANTTGASLYVDGKEVASGELELSASGGEIDLGCAPNNTYFYGRIAAARILAMRVLPELDWVEWSGSESTIALWLMNEGSGTEIIDEMGQANGTFNGAWEPFPLKGPR